MTHPNQPIEILLVEDNIDDADLLVDVLQKEQARAKIQVIEDGEAALAYLRRNAPYANAVRPDLILLDLNLPRKSGHELLAEIKADRELKRIPVIILTTSASDLDVTTSYALGANSFVTKPVDLDHLYAIVGAINSFWLRTATLSPRS